MYDISWIFYTIPFPVIESGLLVSGCSLLPQHNITLSEQQFITTAQSYVNRAVSLAQLLATAKAQIRIVGCG